MVAVTRRDSVITRHRVGVLCALLGLFLYCNSLHGEHVFDDTVAILENDDVQMKTPWSDLLWNDYWGAPMSSPESHKSYRPLTVATFRLNYMLHELQPLGYHLVNVLLHSAVCYLYVLLCGVVFSEVWPALIAGLLFAVHPIHTEAVCGVVGRAELMAAIFFILSFTFYNKSRQHDNNSGRSNAWLLGSLFLAVLSMLSKEQGITVVAVCMVCDFIHNFQAHNQSLLKLMDAILTDTSKLPGWLTHAVKRAFVAGVVTIMCLALRVYFGAPSRDTFHVNINPAVALDTPYRQLSWLYLTFVNSWLLLNPWNLNVDWRFGGVPLINSLIDPLNLLTVLTLLSVGALGVWCVCGNEERHRIVALALSLLVLPYLPASNLFFPVGFVVAERVLYLPSMGFCMLVGYGAWHLVQRTESLRKMKECRSNHSRIWHTLVVAFIAYVGVTHSVKTVLRNPEWRSHIPLFTSGLRFNPRNGLLLSNLGKEYDDLGEMEKAEKMIMMGVAASPTHSGAYMNLGKIRYHDARYTEAVQPFRKALELIPMNGNGTKRFISISYMLAVSLTLSENVTHDQMMEALEVCDTALSRKSSEFSLYVARSFILLELNRTTEALVTVERGLIYNSSSTELYINRGMVYSALGDREQAKDSYQTCLDLKPDFLLALKKLAWLYSRDQQNEEALPLWQKIKELEPSNVDAYNGIATALFIRKDYEQCEQVLLEGLKLFPQNVNLIFNVANLYYKTNRFNLAAHYLQLTVELDPHYGNAKSLLDKALKRAKKEWL